MAGGSGQRNFGTGGSGGNGTSFSGGTGGRRPEDMMICKGQREVV